MRRLLQGDVGSGKTIVALEAAVIAIENGYQVALMAPTEILATQHYLSARRILEAAGYRIVLLTGSQEAGRKKQVRHHIAQGNAQLVIGTHALIQETVEFDKLGLVIVDEQHRFGVMQRFRLMKKAGRSRTRRAGDDGDAHPAHAGAHAFTAISTPACSTNCRRDARRSPRAGSATSAPARSGSSCASRWPPGIRPTSSIPSSKRARWRAS